MISIKNISITLKSNIRDALKTIDNGSLQIAFVVNDIGQLIGSITDGDIRRGLLKGFTLNDSIKNIYNSSPKSCHIDTSNNQLKHFSVINNIQQIPLVDSDGKLVNVKITSEILKEETFENTVIIMAGGLGSRLGELTKDTPKPLLKVAQKPILHTIIENFATHGFSNFILSVNYKSEQIKQYFKDGKELGVNIEYIDEDKRMGTAGSLSLLSTLPQKPFFVMNGDILTSIDFKHMLDFHTQNSACATMGVREYENQIPFGVVNTEGKKILSIEEKPVQNILVSAGIYILNPVCVDHIPKDKFYDMPTLFQNIIERNLNIKAYPITDYWIDIGHIKEYEKAQKDYSKVFENE